MITILRLFLKAGFTFITAIVFSSLGFSQNYVPTGSESVSFGTIDLTTSTSWATDKSANPGYFSSVGTASFTNASDAHHINGWVRHYADAANQSFSYPVGTGSALHTLNISGTRSSNSIISTTFETVTTNTGSKGPGVVSVFPNAEWPFNNEQGTFSGTVTVRIPSLTIYATPTIILLGWDGAQWVSLSGTGGTASGNTAGSTVSGTYASNISKIALGSTAFPLPLTFVSFSGVNNNCVTSLSWVTTNEVNTSHFVVEYSSNGADFKAIGTIQAKGFGGKTYYFSTTQSENVGYYRLKSVDVDGSYKYERIIVVRSNCSGVLPVVRLFPNPIVDGSDLNVVFNNGNYNGKLQIVLVNAIGQQLASRTVVLNGTTHIEKINVQQLASDTYILRFVDDAGNQVFPAQKFVKY